MAKGKLTPQLQSRICRLIADGNYVEAACGAVGITKQTYYTWLKVGEDAKSGKYHDFLDAIKIAEQEAEAQYVGIINKAANDGTWQAAAWWLERRQPDRWGRKERHEHSGGISLQVEYINDWRSSEDTAPDAT